MLVYPPAPCFPSPSLPGHRLLPAWDPSTGWRPGAFGGGRVRLRADWAVACAGSVASLGLVSCSAARSAQHVPKPTPASDFRQGVRKVPGLRPGANPRLPRGIVAPGPWRPLKGEHVKLFGCVFGVRVGVLLSSVNKT